MTSTTTTTTMPAPAAAAPLFVYSASRGKVIDGEKDAPGCERRYAGQYLFGFKQAQTTALTRGSALHAMAEHLQLTGELLEPESELGALLASGAHLLSMCGKLLVEHEHIGELPDGTPYVAYLDGHSERALHGTGTIIVQDLKTTGAPRYALRGVNQDDPADVPPEERALVGSASLGGDALALRNDSQGMFYAWILLCAPPHWYAPTLPDGHYGSRHWQWWDPKERDARVARLRWIYFLTNGNPRAWEETDFVLPAQALAYMNAKIMPAVARIKAIHQWRLANPGGTLDELDRTPAACKNQGRWCGTYEHGACNFENIGTPINDLIQLRVRKTMTPAERLAQLRAGTAAAPAAAPPAPEAPAASPPAPAAPAAPSPAAVTSETAHVVAPVSEKAAPGSAAAELTRGQKAAATRAANKAAAAGAAIPTAAPGAGVNPPEAKEALAKLAAEASGVVNVTNVAAPAPAPVPVAVVTLIGVDEIARFLVSQGYAVSKSGGAQ